MDLSEIKTLLEEQGKAMAAFRTSIDKRFEQEAKERDEMEARLNRIGFTSLGSTKSGNPGDVAAEHKALSKFIRSGDDAELKALSVGSDPDGGYTVLPQMSRSMTTRLWDLSPMRGLARGETLSSGDAFEEIDDRGEAGATWVSETGSRSPTDTPKIGKILIPLHEIYALQPVTQKLLDTSDFDLGAWVDGKITDKFGRTEGGSFINGSGVGKPRGLLTYDTTTDADGIRAAGKIQHVVSGASSGFAASSPADALISMMWKLRGPYRKGATWLMNSNTASVIDKFKDANGQYIWRPSMTAGAQSSLLGYPVEIDEGMPDIAENAYPIAFADFKMAYYIIDRLGVKMLRDPYTSKPNVLFYAYKRVGGGLGNDDAIKLLKIAA